MRNIVIQYEIYSSNIWQGMFIDINGSNLCRALTIGNIYRPPHDNNNNVNIQQFISELSPIIEILQSKNTYTAIVGDFNINLLKISERDKFGEFFDLICTNNLFPQLTFITRFAKQSCSLIDQIFCKTPHKKHVAISTYILISNISDHLPCIVNLGISEKITKRQKYTRTRTMNDTMISDFREPLSCNRMVRRLAASSPKDSQITVPSEATAITLALNYYRHMGRVQHDVVIYYDSVDQLAKETLDHDIDPLTTVHLADLKPLINSYIQKEVQITWDVSIHGRDLYLLKPTLGPTKRSRHLTRAEEVVVTRLRIGHNQGHKIPYLVPRTTNCLPALWPDSDN